jgi:hypothetical protein
MWSTVKGGRGFPVVLLLSAGLLGCPLVSFEYLDISCSVGEGENYYAGEDVRLAFSLDPDREETERVLILNEGNLRRSPVFSWRGRELSLRPPGGWKKGAQYRLSLEGRIRTEDGRSYTAEILRSFIYGREGNDFSLESSGLEENCLVFRFSKPPGVNSFGENFSLRPDIDYFLDFSGDTVRLQPKSPWKINTRYTWSIGGMESADGYAMRREYSASFTGPGDTEIPYPLEPCPVNRSPGPPYLWRRGKALEGNLENGEGIGFVFSKPMDQASLRSGISLYPAVKGWFEEAGEDSVIFFPEENYRPETEYRITLSSALKDSLGLGLFKDHHYYFTIAYRYLEVEKLSLDANPRALEDGGIPQDHFLQSGSSLELKIAFSSAVPPAARRAAADSVSLSVLFPASAHNPDLLSVQWLDGGALLSLRYRDLSPSTGGTDNYYQIKILSGESGPAGASGEYLKEDLWYVFRAR